MFSVKWRLIDYGRRDGGLSGRAPRFGLEDRVDGGVIPDRGSGIRQSVGVGEGGQAYGSIQYRAGHMRPEGKTGI